MANRKITSFFGRPGAPPPKIGKENKTKEMNSDKVLGKRKQPENSKDFNLEQYFPEDPADTSESAGKTDNNEKNVTSWNSALKAEFQKRYFKDLSRFVDSQFKSKTVYPPEHQIFEAFRLCPLNKVRVVIIGQDPYHGPGQGHGVCFSVQRGIRVPPSLRNIYKEMHKDVGAPIPQHGNLQAWAEQGVLLLNTVLTVVKGMANSHKKKGWEKFTDAVIAYINKHCSNVVFLCWGSPAQKKAALVSRSRHEVIMSSHPSPLGATKTKFPFIGSRCFSRVNKYITDKHGPEYCIKWDL